MTVVTVLTVELLIFESASLKDKRSVVRQVIQRTRNRFPVAGSEVGSQNDPGCAILAFAAVASDSQIAHATVQQVLRYIEGLRLDCQVGVVDTETITL